MEEHTPHKTDGSPEVTLLLHYIKGEATAVEKKTVEEWLYSHPSHEKELEQIARIYFAQETKHRIQSRDPLAAFRKVEEQIRQKRRRLWITKAATVAACLAGIITLSTVMAIYLNKKATTLPQTITITANAGMRTQFDLPDGTIVHLNSGSTFTYPVPYDKNERKVTLTGEAYFKVAPDTRKPFTVNVYNDQFKVKVLGTEFNIQAYTYDNEINTTLVSGSVELEYAGAKIRRLTPGEKAVYNQETKQLSVSRSNTQIETAWTEGKLIFRDTPIPEVLKRLSHYYNVKFEISDPEIEKYHFTGTFINKQLSQVLDYLQISSNINYKINSTEEDDSTGMKYSTITLWKKK